MEKLEKSIKLHRSKKSNDNIYLISNIIQTKYLSKHPIADRWVHHFRAFVQFLQLYRWLSLSHGCFHHLHRLIQLVLAVWASHKSLVLLHQYHCWVKRVVRWKTVFSLTNGLIGLNNNVLNTNPQEKPAKFKQLSFLNCLYVTMLLLISFKMPNWIQNWCAIDCKLFILTDWWSTIFDDIFPSVVFMRDIAELIGRDTCSTVASPSW